MPEYPDFFGINDACSIENCSILVLIFLIFTGTIISIVLFFIIRRLRARSTRLYVQVRAINVKTLDKESVDDEKPIEKPANIVDFTINCTLNIQKNENFGEQNSEINEETNKNSNSDSNKLKYIGENLTKSLSGSSKGSRKNFFNEKLNNKSHMFSDDSSIQYEEEGNNEEEAENNTIKIEKLEENPNILEENNRENCRLGTILEENEGYLESVREKAQKKQ